MNNPLNINDDIITKYLCGEASPEEAMSIEIWKSASVQNQLYFDTMEQSFLLISGIEKVSSDKKKSWNKINKNIEGKGDNRRWIYGLAAVLVSGLLAIIFLINPDGNHQLELYADRSQIKQSLSDNSIVTLEKNGRILLDKDFGKSNRKLTLAGKAAFAVNHDDKLPFIVESYGVFIEDLGTVFTVESWPESDTVYVVVNEGIVRLYDEYGSEIIIKAGEKAWYIRSQKQIITSLDTKVLKFDFKDTKLGEIVSLLTDTYDVKIELQPKEIGECRITTQFFDEEVATIITVLCETLSFRYEYKDYQYFINGKPCR